jgi:hypothetical protein
MPRQQPKPKPPTVPDASAMLPRPGPLAVPPSGMHSGDGFLTSHLYQWGQKPKPSQSR